jgi:hypothetical protein
MPVERLFPFRSSSQAEKYTFSKGSWQRIVFRKLFRVYSGWFILKSKNLHQQKLYQNQAGQVMETLFRSFKTLI